MKKCRYVRSFIFKYLSQFWSWFKMLPYYELIYKYLVILTFIPTKYIVNMYCIICPILESSQKTKLEKKVLYQFFVCGIGDLWRYSITPNWSQMSLSDPLDNLGSFRTFKGPLFHKKETGGALFLEVQYAGWALKYHQIHTTKVYHRI